MQTLKTLIYQLRKNSSHRPYNHQQLVERGEWLSEEEMTLAVEREKHAAIQLMKVSAAGGGHECWGSLPGFVRC